MTPTSVDGMSTGIGKFGSATVSIEATTGRILAIAQNTTFSEDADARPTIRTTRPSSTRATTSTAARRLRRRIDVQALHPDRLAREGPLRQRGAQRHASADHQADDQLLHDGDWVNVGERPRSSNFGGGGGYVGTPMQFTAASLNSGFFAHGREARPVRHPEGRDEDGRHCAADGEPVDHGQPSSRSSARTTSRRSRWPARTRPSRTTASTASRRRSTGSPTRTATRSPRPQTTCTQVIDPKVAATAAFALQGVMSGGGTGAAWQPARRHAAHRQDRNRTRTFQTWMVESSTKVATAVWVGNSTARATSSSAYTTASRCPAALHDRPRDPARRERRVRRRRVPGRRQRT